MDTLFGKIINKEIPSEIVFENDKFLAIKDKYPIAPVHLLIMPKQEFANLQSMQEKDLLLLPELFTIVQKLAKEFNIEEGYRVLTNNGESAGQTIFHLHFHLIGGRKLGSMG